jgi:hypothetical protein
MACEVEYVSKKINFVEEDEEMLQVSVECWSRWIILSWNP